MAQEWAMQSVGGWRAEWRGEREPTWENHCVARTRTTKTALKADDKADDEAPDGKQLRHVLVVGGTVAEWDALGRELWLARRNDLAKAVAHAGAMWLTIRPFESDGTEITRQRNQDEFRVERLIDVREGCTVIVDPIADGQQRILDAIDTLGSNAVRVIDEPTLTGVLMAPAPIEPDLTIVLGPVTRLPPSLVWELAYSEIVFIDTVWDDLAAAHVERATDEFSRRHRRFGNIQ